MKYQKGNIPHNKNKTMVEEYGEEKSKEIKEILKNKSIEYAKININGMKGKKSWNNGLTKETDSRIKDMSDKTRQILREKSIENAKINPNYGMKGKHHTEETRQILIKNAIKQFENGFPEETLKKLRDNAKNNPNAGMKGKHQSEKAKQIARRPRTEEEKINLRRKALEQFKNGMSEEVKNKIKANAKINPNFGMKGKYHTDKTKIRLSSSWDYEKHFTEKTRRRISSTQQGIKLEDWKNYISREPYDQKWNNNFKNLIRKRDNQICMNCGKHREQLSRALNVHHINYNKKLSIPENCISICNSCHNITNFNRKHWTKFFQSLLSERYGYKYSENSDIILNLQEDIKNA